MPNHLLHSNSLYLRKHAENPIDWWPWCDEALAKAKQEDKPIFLSIGYSSCHWCTVMEGEAFSDEAIAQYMNENFVAIKVDREERPDIDSIYMQSLQLMTGHGGWPLNVFLTPVERVPFYGGTYFPVEPKYNRPGFLRILQSLRNFYNTDKAKLEAVQGEILQRLQQGIFFPTALDQDSPPSPNLDETLLITGLKSATKSLQINEPGPRFPTIPTANLNLRGARFSSLAGTELSDNPPDNQVGNSSEKQVGDPSEKQVGDPSKETSTANAMAQAKQRGLNLALGGIFDHVAGGFHRYTVDPTWTVPHFEKMLYDNGQIVEYLAQLWSAGVQEPAFERAIAKTVEWLKREMIAPEGYFYAAQDADNFITPEEAEPEEGDFYVWSHADLSQWLSPEAMAELEAHFTVTSEGNFESKNVLQRTTTGVLSVRLEATLAILFQQRYGFGSPSSLGDVTVFAPARTSQDAKTMNWAGRIPPVTDTKMIVAWNSLMISGLAKAATVFQQVAYLDLASQSAHFILEHQWIDGRFHRLNYDGSVSVNAQSEDYALFIKALLDLDQASFLLSHSPSSNAPSSNSSSSSDSDTALNQENSLWKEMHWKEKAIALQSEFDKWLWSIEQGGYFNTASDASNDLIVRERSYMDNATPSANGVAIANLIRLFLLTDDMDYLERAEQALTSFLQVLTQAPRACPSLFSALDWYTHQTSVKLQSASSEILQVLTTGYFPTTVFKPSSELPKAAIGLVCRGTTCNQPATTLDQLLSQLSSP